uniref:Uncharacterized protein n=1 Tax=Romanomermis culicivorax TaxID=13658 RepID=A0A915KHL2_ROMCU
MTHDRQKLLPDVHQKSAAGDVASRKDAKFCFKSYVIISMTIIWSCHAILLNLTRTRPPAENQFYFSTTVVFLAEICKFFMALCLAHRANRFNLEKSWREFRTDFIGKPDELLKMSVPSILYAVQNNLDFVALANLEPGVYQVTCQLKVVTTAIFMVVMLGKRYSMARWISILLLFAGVAMVQLDAMTNHPIPSSMLSTVGNIISNISLFTTATPSKEPIQRQQNHFIGLGAVLITCVTAGFSGVYFEKMLKNVESSTTLWVRNMQMYFTGIISAGLACWIKEGTAILDKGFFFGYYDLVYIIIGLLSVGGIYISMVIKYLDNLLKSFASAASILLVSFLSLYLFGANLDILFVLGSFTVIGAILLYNYVKE